MSNLLKKSKFLLGLAIVAVFAVVGVHQSLAYSQTVTLKQGSTGSQVMSLQQTLNANAYLVATTGAGSPGMESSYFGTKTKAAVMAFQSAHALKADGIVGVQTGTALAALTGGSVSYPAGCTSTTGFSTTTGGSCAAPITVLPTGCMTTSGFSPINGAACNSGATTTLPAGCMSTAGFSPTTGAACNGGSVATTGPLQGGAGNATITNTSVDTESTVSEGTTEKVAGFKVEATGSDISVNNVQVTLQNVATGSTWLSRYASEVSIWMGNTKVGSLPVSSFSQSGTTYTGSIAVSNAVVREGASNRQYFYVGLTANSTIDSNDATGNSFNVTVNNVRYTDATGVVLTTTYSGNITNGVKFQTLASSGDVKVILTRDSSNPIAQNVEVSDTGSTDNVTLLTMGVKAQGTDVSIDSLPFTLTTVGATPSEELSQVSVWDGSNNLGEYNISGTTTSPMSIAINLDNTLVISKDSTKVLTIKAKVNKIAVGNFGQGDNVMIALDTANDKYLDATGSSISNVSGSASGEVQTFYSEGLSVSNFTSSVNTNSNTTGQTTTANYTVSFKVTAFGNTYYIPKSLVRATASNGAAGLYYSVLNSAGADNAADVSSTASSLTSSASTYGANFVVNDGQSETFTATITVTKGGTPVYGFYRIQLNDVGYATDGGTTGYTLTPLLPAQNYQTSQTNIQA